MADLFADDVPPPVRDSAPSADAPLAERLRPQSLAEVVGQSHLTGPDGAWVVVTTSRALHRAGRHADALGLSVDAAVERLFGATERAATETELQPTRPGASLPAVFGGWG